MECDEITLKIEPLRDQFESYRQQEFDISGNHFGPMLHIVGLFWANCKYYRTPTRIVVLLREICNLILEQCQAYMVPEEIFKNEVEDAMEKIRKSEKLLTIFRDKYYKFRENLPTYCSKTKAMPDRWEFDSDLVFGKYNAVLKNLSKIEVICFGIFGIDKGTV